MTGESSQPEDRRPGLEVGISFEIEMLMKVRAVIESHATECLREPKAILLNPGNHELLGWDECLGLPVLPDDRAEPMRARLVCGTGRAGYCEEGQVVWDEDGEAYVFIPAEETEA
jgi:hypothetical protein